MNVSKFHPLPSIRKIVLYKVNNFYNFYKANNFDRSIDTMPINLLMSSSYLGIWIEEIL